jgi:hypothetical protein
MIGFTAPYTFITQDYRQYSAIADLHTLQFTVTHALGLSVFTSRILALQIEQEVFISEPNSFLAIILQLPIPKIQLNSIPPLLSAYPGRLASRISAVHSALLN